MIKMIIIYSIPVKKPYRKTGYIKYLTLMFCWNMGRVGYDLVIEIPFQVKEALWHKRSLKVLTEDFITKGNLLLY